MRICPRERRQASLVLSRSQAKPSAGRPLCLPLCGPPLRLNASIRAGPSPWPLSFVSGRVRRFRGLSVDRNISRNISGREGRAGLALDALAVGPRFTCRVVRAVRSWTRAGRRDRESLSGAVLWTGRLSPEPGDPGWCRVCRGVVVVSTVCVLASGGPAVGNTVTGSSPP